MNGPADVTVVLGDDVRLSARGDSNLRKIRACPPKRPEAAKAGQLNILQTVVPDAAHAPR